ncbi:MAG: cadherin-like domain-containing protein [Bacteroidetes bacterium]|nr:cadherin-like domain-containing protein [Bacteroidota bacterium]
MKKSFILRTVLMSLFLLTNFISAQSVISDVQCSNNGTFNTAADDFVAFKLNPQPPGGIVVHPFKYNISATYLGNPVTITDMAGVAVTQGDYGENPYYRINNGTIAAAGNIVITLTAQFGAMTQEVVNLTNPGTCSTVCTGASTGNKVTYYYENVLPLDLFTSQNATLPKFDEGTSRTLTGVKIDYGFTASGSVSGENRAANPQTVRIKTEVEPYQFDINTVAHPIASKIIVQTPGYPTSIPVAGAVLVPASGAWPGDDPGVAPNFTPSTLTAMGNYANTWLQSALASGIDPTTNPLWVTQLTGNAGDDDDITVAVNPTFAFNAPSINLTAPLDLNAYKGASTFPIAVDAYGSITASGSGGQFLFSQATKARYFVKVEYTYDCISPIIADNDSGAPINGTIGGSTGINIFANDVLGTTTGVNPADVILTTGTIPTGIVLDVTTGAVSVNPGTPAGNYTFTYQICEVANPTNCDDAVVSVMVTSNVVALSNITCNPNGTLEDGSDDYITFSMLAPAPVLFYEAPYTYSVTATQNGNPVTVTLSDGSPATNVGYNSLAESFRLANGSSNNGDVTVTVTPNWGSYAPNSIVLVNPGSCTLVACSGGTNKTVTYTYQSPILLSGVNNQIFIPKFNQTGGKVLTGVAINYTSNARNFVIIEGTGNGGNEFSGIIKFRPLFKYNGVNVSTPTDYLLWQSPSYDGGNTYDILGTGVGITVPAQGAWTGDVSSSTLNAMPWTSNSVYAGIDPRTDPRWVTNITGNSTFDDDFYFSPFYNTYNYNGSVNYTSATDLASFTGASGNVPFTYSHNIPTIMSIGGYGISNIFTQVYFTTTVTYTYTETCIDAVLDINQTPINVPVSGNVITNDEFTGTATVTSAQFYNASGVLTNLPIGTATPVFTPAGVPAGTMLLNADGTYTYTPTTGFVGEIPVNYTLTNNLGSTDSTTLTIKVIPNTVVGNDNPIAQHDTSFTEEGVSVSSTVLNNDSDPDGDALTVTSATGLTIGTATVVSGVNAAGTPVANAGTVQLNANGTYTYVPAAGFVGTVNPLPYVISDGNGGTATANIYITVVGAGSTTNNTFANDDANTAPKGVTMTGNVKTNDTDPEGNTTTVTAATVFSVNGVANGTALTIGTATVIPGVGSVTLNANGTYSFVPVATYVGTVVIPYTICDNGVPQACDQATLELTSLDLAVCYELPNTGTAGVDTKHGITLLQRAGVDNGNWPMNRSSAHTALESNTKGFVITRVPTSGLSAITNPVEGMMVYDTTAKCLKIYVVDNTTPANTGWKCFSTPACP